MPEMTNILPFIFPTANIPCFNVNQVSQGTESSPIPDTFLLMLQKMLSENIKAPTFSIPVPLQSMGNNPQSDTQEMTTPLKIDVPVTTPNPPTLNDPLVLVENQVPQPIPEAQIPQPISKPLENEGKTEDSIAGVKLDYKPKPPIVFEGKMPEIEKPVEMTATENPPVLNQLLSMIQATYISTQNVESINPQPSMLISPQLTITFPKQPEMDTQPQKTVNRTIALNVESNNSQDSGFVPILPKLSIPIPVTTDINSEPEANARDGPIKIPSQAAIPSAEIDDTSDAERKQETAGPRIIPFNQTEIKGEKPSVSSPEEAVKIGTQREVPKDVSRPVDWLNDVFRKPANELTRDGFRFPEERIQSRMEQNAIPKVEVFKSSPEIISHQEPPKTEKSSAKPVADIPDLKAKIEFTQNKSTDSNPSVKPVENEDIQKPTNPTNEVIVQKLTNSIPASVKSSSKPQIVESVKPELNVTIGNSEIITTKPNITEAVKPLHILDDVPTRLASEIKLVESENSSKNELMTLRVQLKPPRLGPLEITIIRRDDGLDVKLIARTAFAREILNQRGDEIRQAIENQGIQLRKFEISNPAQNQNNHEHTGTFANQHWTPHGRGGHESSEQLVDFFKNDDPLERIESDFEESTNSIPQKEYEGLNILV